MGRVPYPGPEIADAEFRDMLAAAVAGGRPALNLDRMLPWTGALAPVWLRFGRTIRERLSVGQRQCEIAIVRVGVLCGSDYEVHQHSILARRAGVGEAELAAVRTGNAAALPAADAAVLRYTDALVHHVRAEDATFRAVEEAVGTQGAAELTLVIGFYLMVCRFLRNFDVEIERGQQMM